MLHFVVKNKNKIILIQFFMRCFSFHFLKPYYVVSNNPSYITTINNAGFLLRAERYKIRGGVQKKLKCTRDSKPNNKNKCR